jgi:hypothetical protein
MTTCLQKSVLFTTELRFTMKQLFLDNKILIIGIQALLGMMYATKT